MVDQQRKLVEEAREKELKLKAMLKDLEDNAPKNQKSFGQSSQLGLVVFILAIVSVLN